MYLNPLSLGYESIAEIGVMTGLADKEKVQEKLRNQPNIALAPSSLGKYTLYGVLLAHNLSEISETIARIDSESEKSLDVLILTDLWENPWHPENIVIKPFEQEKLTRKTTDAKTRFEPVTIDETDKCIAKMLMENSRMQFNAISKKLGISTKKVYQRYQRLREKNVLNLSSISVDLLKIGYYSIADCYIKIDHKVNQPKVEAQLLQIPNASFCAKFVGGAYDLRVAVIVADLEDVFRFKRQVHSIKNIKTAEFYLHENPGPWPSDFIGMLVIKKKELCSE